MCLVGVESTLGQHLVAHSRIKIVEGDECTEGQR